MLRPGAVLSWGDWEGGAHSCSLPNDASEETRGCIPSCENHPRAPSPRGSRRRDSCRGEGETRAQLAPPTHTPVKTAMDRFFQHNRSLCCATLSRFFLSLILQEPTFLDDLENNPRVC